jgi:hypothetical protein
MDELISLSLITALSTSCSPDEIGVLAGWYEARAGGRLRCSADRTECRG